MGISAKIVIGQPDSSEVDLQKPLSQKTNFDVKRVLGGEDVVNLLRGDQPPDVVVLDNRLQSPTPFEISRMIKADPQLSGIPLILLVSSEDLAQNKPVVQAGFVEVFVHPVDIRVLESRIDSFIELDHLRHKTENIENVLQTFTTILDAKDPTTRGHADRVATYVVEFGKALGMSQEEIVILRKGGMLHDVGKIAIPDLILNKPGKFTPEEFEVMKLHPTLGCDICRNLDFVQDALPLVRHHHEKLDGTGYPDKLKGDQVPLMARMVTIVDIFDALRSKRPYKEEFSVDRSFDIMWQEARKGWWDQELLTTWEKIVREKHF